MDRLLSLQPLLQRTAGALLRWSLIAIFLGYGILKFTAAEAAAIAPLTEHSFFLFWLNPLIGVQGGSNLIGVAEIVIALLIALRRPFPRLSGIGSLAAAGALFTTVSFLFSTPGLDPMSTDAGFLLKDVVLLGAALWSAAEAFGAVATDRDPVRAPVAAAA